MTDERIMNICCCFCWGNKQFNKDECWCVPCCVVEYIRLILPKAFQCVYHRKDDMKNHRQKSFGGQKSSSFHEYYFKSFCFDVYSESLLNSVICTLTFSRMTYLFGSRLYITISSSVLVVSSLTIHQRTFYPPPPSLLYDDTNTKKDERRPIFFFPVFCSSISWCWDKSRGKWLV